MPDTRKSNTSAKAGALVALTGKTSTDVAIVHDGGNLAPENRSNPVQKGGKKPKRYFSFQLKDDMADEHIDGKEEAMAFNRDHKDIITKVNSYSNIHYWNKNKERRAMQYKLAVEKIKSSPTAVAKANNDDDSDTKLMLQKMSGSREVETFQGYYRTTGRATKFVLFFKWLGVQGDDYWCWKPKLMVPALTSYFDVRPPLDPTLKAAFSTLQYAPRPDPQDREKGQVIVFSPSSGRNYDIPVFTSYAIFDIPVASLSSPQNEAEWIQGKCTSFFEEMRAAMKAKCFKTLLTQLDDRFTEKLYDPKKITNLVKFLDKAVVRVVPIENIATHVITSVTVILSRLLFAARLPQPKYTTTLPVEGVNNIAMVDPSANIADALDDADFDGDASDEDPDLPQELADAMLG